MAVSRFRTPRSHRNAEIVRAIALDWAADRFCRISLLKPMQEGVIASVEVCIPGIFEFVCQISETSIARQARTDVATNAQSG